MLQTNIDIVHSIMDETATFEHDTPKGKAETLQTIIDTLGSYPKPRTKEETDEPNTQILGAYLCISNVRNACKLALLGVYDEVSTLIIIDRNNIQALNLLLSIR